MHTGIYTTALGLLLGLSSNTPAQTATSGHPAGDVDPCTLPDAPAKIIAKFNSVPQFTEANGRLLSVDHLHNEFPNSSSCRGNFHFSDNVTKVMSFGLEIEGSSPNVANGIPIRCKTDDTGVHIEHEVPRILDLGDGAASITSVEFLTDVPRVTYYPAIGQEPELHMLQCPVNITWTNGHRDFGYYMEWEDHHQQVRVSFTPRPIQPPTRDY